MEFQPTQTSDQSRRRLTHPNIPPFIPASSYNRSFTYKLSVNPDCVGLVLGSKGRTINKIQLDTGAFASLQQPNPELQRSLPYFFLRGSTMSVIRAAIKITEIATEAAHRNRAMKESLSSPE